MYSIYCHHMHLTEDDLRYIMYNQGFVCGLVKFFHFKCTKNFYLSTFCFAYFLHSFPFQLKCMSSTLLNIADIFLFFWSLITFVLSIIFPLFPTFQIYFPSPFFSNDSIQVTLTSSYKSCEDQNKNVREIWKEIHPMCQETKLSSYF